MVQSAFIARLPDGLPLCASVDDAQSEAELAETKQQQKLLIRKMNPQTEPRCAIESGKYTMYYMIRSSLVYFCICPSSYPRKLAFSYLEELAGEFERSESPQGQALAPNLRPYQFQKFEGFVGKTMRVYQDVKGVGASGAGGKSGLDRLNEDLKDVTRVMTKNMEDLLWRGDSLDRMSTLSTSLRSESAKYRARARKINLDALYRKWAPVGVLVLLLVIVLWWRAWWR